MTVLNARILVVCALAGLCGCKGGVASFGGSSGSEISGPPTINEMYQARNPRKCAEVTAPPTVEQAIALIQCSTESDTTGSSKPLITLLTDLHVEIGSPRDSIVVGDPSSDVDVRAKVYPLRGQGTMWQCSPAAQYSAGQNCVKYPAGPDGQGTCYKTTFGDWTCRMTTGSSKQVQKLKGPTTY